MTQPVQNQTGPAKGLMGARWLVFGLLSLLAAFVVVRVSSRKSLQAETSAPVEAAPAGEMRDALSPEVAPPAADPAMISPKPIMPASIPERVSARIPAETKAKSRAKAAAAKLRARKLAAMKKQAKASWPAARPRPVVIAINSLESTVNADLEPNAKPGIYPGATTPFELRLIRSGRTAVSLQARAAGPQSLSTDYAAEGLKGLPMSRLDGIDTLEIAYISTERPSRALKKSLAALDVIDVTLRINGVFVWRIMVKDPNFTFVREYAAYGKKVYRATLTADVRQLFNGTQSYFLSRQIDIVRR